MIFFVYYMGTLGLSRYNWLDWSPGVGFVTRKTRADALKNNATTPEGSVSSIVEYTAPQYNIWE